MTEDKRFKTSLQALAILVVIYVLSIGPVFHYARRSCFPYYQPVCWLVHQSPEVPQPCPQARDVFCAYINWWDNHL